MKPLDEALRRAARSVCGLEPDAEPSIGISVATTAIREALASLAADGWELMPRVATEAMMDAGVEAAPMFLRDDEYGRRIRSSPSTTDCATIYAAMLAAASKTGETT